MTDPRDDTDDTVATWRTLPTDGQPSSAPSCRRWSEPVIHRTTLVFTARQLAAENMASVVMFSDVAPPPDAARLFGWQ